MAENGLLPEGFKEGQCPMTIEHCKEYNVTDGMAKRFCSENCCPICGELFLKKFGKRKVLV